MKRSVISLLWGVAFLVTACAPRPGRPIPDPAPNPNLYPIAGRWTGGKAWTIGVYDRGTGQLTLKHSNFSEGYTQTLPIGGGVLDYGVPLTVEDRNSVSHPVVYLPGQDRTLAVNQDSAMTPQFFPPGSPDWLPLTGDWDGDGLSGVGWYDPGSSTFYLRNALTGRGGVDHTVTFNEPGQFPLVGDWDGDGRWTIGLYDPLALTFFLRNSLTPGKADQVIKIDVDSPKAFWRPIVGDWDGSGKMSVGLFDLAKGNVYLYYPTPTVTETRKIFFGEGNRGWHPLVGDWNGDGITSIGLYIPTTNIFYLRNSNSNGEAEITFGYGYPNPQFRAISGDWDGDGRDSIGFWHPPESFILRNENSTGDTDLEANCAYTVTTPFPVVGDWTGENRTRVGLYDRERATFLLCNSLKSALANSQFAFGQPGLNWLPLAGDWNGDGKWSIGLYEPELSRFHLSDTINPAEEIYTFVFGRANENWIPLAGDWNGSGRMSVGLYDPLESVFYLRVVQPPRYAWQGLTFSSSGSKNRNPDLRYFGYYSVDGFDYSSTSHFVPQVAELGNSNIAHIHPQFEEYELPHFRASLAALRQAQLRAVVNVQWIFVRQQKFAKAQRKPDWQAEFARFKPLLDEYKDVIEAFYFDEPIELGINTADFRDYSKLLKEAYPNTRIIVIESASQILNENLTADYLEYVTDIGVDLYYTDPTYLSNSAEFYRVFRKMVTDFKDKAFWLAVDGYIRRGSTARDLIDATNAYYSLAISTPRVAGILLFLYSTGNENFQSPLISLYSQPGDGERLKALHQRLGQEIIGKRK
jgi:hypothetical protein